jgi:hypothetical protein
LLIIETAFSIAVKMRGRRGFRLCRELRLAWSGEEIAERRPAAPSALYSGVKYD